MYNPGYATGCKRLFSFVRDSKHPSWAKNLGGRRTGDRRSGLTGANPPTLLDRSVYANGFSTQSSRDSIVIYSPAARRTRRQSLCRATVPPTTLPNFFPSGIVPAYTPLIKGLRVRQDRAGPDNRKFKTIRKPKLLV